MEAIQESEEMKDKSCASHHAPFAAPRLCSETSELLQHATFQTLVFLLILKATISITLLRVYLQEIIQSCSFSLLYFVGIFYPPHPP